MMGDGKVLQCMKLGFIGAGNMALAIVRGIVNKGLVPPANIFVSSPTGPSNHFTDLEVVSTKSNVKVFRNVDIVILATKPQHIQEAIRSICPRTSDDDDERYREPTMVLSLAAGITIDELHEMWKKHSLLVPSIFRVMPNVNAAVGHSVTAVAGNPNQTQAGLIRSIFSCLGSVHFVEEKHMDSVTALCGSGPAFAAIITEAMADGAVLMGLPRDLALQMSAEVLMGTSANILQRNIHPAVLKDSVASPGGTTIHGIMELEKSSIRNAMISAIAAATNRGKELSRRA